MRAKLFQFKNKNNYVITTSIKTIYYCFYGKGFPYPYIFGTQKYICHLNMLVFSWCHNNF